MSGISTVAWFSFFPVEWLPDVPAEVRDTPKRHPASWQRVLLEELERSHPELRLHIVVLRKQFRRSLTFERRNTTFHLIRTPAGLRASSLYWLDTLLIRRVLRRVKPEVVHAWGTEQGAALVATRLRYPAVLTVQGLYSWCAEVGPVTVHERLSAWIERACLPQLPLVTTESTFAANYIRNKLHPAQVEQIEHAPARIFRVVKRQPRRSPIRFVFIGRFESRKGADVLLRALHILHRELDFDLHFIGNQGSSMQERLERVLSPELWRRITFKHNLTAGAVAQELAAATMMIYPTLVDVSPNTVKEAVVAGLPVVASRVGGIPDYVIPGKNGLLFDPGNLEACVQAIRTACRHPLFAQGLVETATLEQMRVYLSPETMAQRFWEVYLQVAKLRDVRI